MVFDQCRIVFSVAQRNYGSVANHYNWHGTFNTVDSILFAIVYYLQLPYGLKAFVETFLFHICQLEYMSIA